MFKQTFVLGFFLVVTLVGYSVVEAGKDKPSQKQDVGPGDMVDIKKKDKRPEKWCCYKELSNYASADGFGEVLFKTLLRPSRLMNNQTICAPKEQNPVLTKVTTCLKRCSNKIEISRFWMQKEYAKRLLNAFKFTLLGCKTDFTQVSDHLYKIAENRSDELKPTVEHPCTSKVASMLSNLNMDPSSLDNFKQSCVDRDVSLACIKEQHIEDQKLVENTTMYLQGLLATFYYILEAKVIADDGTPHDHADDKDVDKCLAEMKGTMDYLQDKVDVPTAVDPVTEPTTKPEPVTIASTTIVSSTESSTSDHSTVVPGDSSTTPDKVTGGGPTSSTPQVDTNITSTPSNTTDNATTIAIHPASNPQPKPTKGPADNNSTGNSGISIKCFHGFDRLPILAAALAVVVRMALAMAVDGS